MAKPSLPELVTLSEAARRLSVNPRLLREARDRGEIRFYRLGIRWQRVDVAEIRAWIESKKEESCPR